MSAGRMCAALMVAATLVAAAVSGILPGAAPAQAAPQWNGRYTLVTYASEKVGTSIAARQSEPDFSGQYRFVTECWSTRCVATVVAGPAPSNPTIPQPQRYTWDGSRWRWTYDWQWECFQGDTAPRVFSPASSFVVYKPQGGGALSGTWHTDILSGPCRGSVIMPIAARPAGR